MSNTTVIDLSETNIENNLICKKYTFNNNEYDIIKYDKNTLKSIEDINSELYKNISKFRSIITRNNKVLVFSPPKSIEYSKFLEINNNSINECWSEEFIDGTMINVFYDNVNEVWEIATKSTVGGNILFFNDIKNYEQFFKDNTEMNLEAYKNITFRSMFFEACNASNFNLHTLDKNYCYTFVMQHPYNRIVTPITFPMLYLIKMYEIDNKNFPIVSIHEINIQSYGNTMPYVFLDTKIKFVNKYGIDNMETLETYCNSDIPYFCVGCMLYDAKGNRSKIRNKNYEIVRKLRGNHPKLQYNYLCLKQENKIKDFLQYYPEHLLLFQKFKLSMFNYTNKLYLNYVDCFIKKNKPLKEYSPEYKCHMYALHQHYTNKLKSENKYVDKKFVIDYFNSLHPAQQMFSINYNKKFLTTEALTNDNEVENLTNDNEVMVN